MYASKLIPRSLNAVTRSTEPVAVETREVESKNVEMLAEWWVCGMHNLDYNCRSENLANLQIVLFLDDCCAILMY